MLQEGHPACKDTTSTISKYFLKTWKWETLVNSDKPENERIAVTTAVILPNIIRDRSWTARCRTSVGLPLLCLHLYFSLLLWKLKKNGSNRHYSSELLHGSSNTSAIDWPNMCRVHGTLNSLRTCSVCEQMASQCYCTASKRTYCDVDPGRLLHCLKTPPVRGLSCSLISRSVSYFDRQFAYLTVKLSTDVFAALSEL